MLRGQQQPNDNAESERGCEAQSEIPALALVLAPKIVSQWESFATAASRKGSNDEYLGASSIEIHKVCAQAKSA